MQLDISSIRTPHPIVNTAPSVPHQGYHFLFAVYLTVQYIATLNIYPNQKWRDFGILLGFTVSNWLLVYATVYIFRYRGWSYMAKIWALWDAVKAKVMRK